MHNILLTNDECSHKTIISPPVGIYRLGFLIVTKYTIRSQTKPGIFCREPRTWAAALATISY